MTQRTDWDFICVGAGITSLAFAAEAVLRRPGVRPLVLEKHTVAGGYASQFMRPLQQAVFDCSLHKLSGMRPGGNLHRIFGRLGLLERLEFVYPATYFNASFGGGDLPLPNDPQGFLAALERRFPHQSAGLRAFFDDVMTHGKDAYFQFQIQTGEYEVDLPRLRQAYRTLRPLTALAGIRRFIDDPRLLDILCASAVYVGALPEELGYLYYLHVLYATLVCGNAYVRGGSQHLSDTLVDIIRKGGGEVLMRHAVEEVLIDGQQRAVGVRTRKGVFSAPSVYINAAPSYALAHLFPSNQAELREVRHTLATLRPSLATTTVYLVTDVAPAQLGLRHSEEMVFADAPERAAALRSEAHASGSAEAMEHAYWHASAMEVTNYHRLEPAGGHVLVLNVLDRIEHWPQRKTPAYRDKKRRAAQAMIGRLSQRRPALAGHIRYHEVSSPLTYKRYTNNTDGAGYGASVGPGATAHHFHHRFPLAGVNFLSAWVAGPSYEAAFGYSEARARSAFPWPRSAQPAAPSSRVETSPVLESTHA
jgi:all-trans-retinol 13,14-reductase